MPRSYTLLFLMFLLLPGSGPALAQEAPVDPIWPLDLPTRYLTSNFMEYRPGRFHAGLDLKTQTVNGFAARAVEAGWIVRVRATPTAYGRAVYLRGDSGRTYVYAHLSRFNDQLRGLVNAQRANTGTYRARLQFKADEVRVQQGDVLGLTGESGTGGPHLHFEVRDRNNRPMEPQAVGFSVGDTIAPVIHHLRVWPVRPETLIQGTEQGHILAAPGGLSGQQPAVRVTGPVAFSARIVDGSDIRGHRLEPSLIEVHLDGELVYSCRNESYDFAENALQRLEWAVMPGVRDHWLHRHPANLLTGREGELWYLGAQGRGLARGRHELRITAADRAGNATAVNLDLVVDDGPHGPRSLENHAWQPEIVHPRISSADSMSHIDITPFFDVDSEAVRAEVDGIRRREYRPENGDPVQAAMVMYSRPVVLTPPQRRAAADQGLRPLGVAREFLAADWPIEASVPVQMAEPKAPKGGDQKNRALDRKTWGLYRWTGKQWNRSDPWRKTAQGTVKLDRPGLYAVLADLSGPAVDHPDQPIAISRGPESDMAGVTLPHWEVLPVALWDLGSGLAAETIRVLLDGEPLIVEPDLPRDRILIELPDGMAPGLHKLTIEAADRVGHRVGRELEIRAE